MNSFRTRRRLLLSLTLFPSEPENYQLIKKYTSSGIFEAPEDGWFKIELFGASGNGGSSGLFIGSRVVGDSTTGESYEEEVYYHTGGGGGGGGGCAVSEIRLKKGEKITLTIGETGSVSKAAIASSMEDYPAMNVVSGGNGGKGSVGAGGGGGYGAAGGSGGSYGGGGGGGWGGRGGTAYVGGGGGGGYGLSGAGGSGSSGGSGSDGGYAAGGGGAQYAAGLRAGNGGGGIVIITYYANEVGAE